MPAGMIRQNEVTDYVIHEAACPRCKGSFNAPMKRSVATGYILSIPFIKSTGRRYTCCPHCGIYYTFSPSVYRKIKKAPSPSLLYRECEKTLFHQRKIYERYTRPSKKKSWAAALLAFFLGLFGLQNVYMGHLKRFAINGFLLLAGILCFRLAFTYGEALVIPCALCLAANIYWGMIDTIRILSGHAKDSKGLFIMTRKQYKKRMKYRASLY